MYIFSIAAPKPDFINIKRHSDVLCPVHLHYSTEIVCVTDGELEMTVSDGKRIIKKGEATVIMPFERHSFETPNHSECFVIEFAPELTEDFSLLTKGKIPQIPVCELDKNIFEMCDKILPAKNPVEKLTAKSVLYPLLSEIYGKCDFADGGNKHEKAFVEATRFACDNFKNGITLESTAKALGVHHVYLSRMFKSGCGMTFTKYLNSLRCSYAAKLLRDETINTSEIAYEAGFGSIRSFNREFKAMFGQTPGEYKETVADMINL